MRELRATLWVVGMGLGVLLAGVCWYVALTAPLIASDGPIILAIFLTVVTFLLWRVRRRFL